MVIPIPKICIVHRPPPYYYFSILANFAFQNDCREWSISSSFQVYFSNIQNVFLCFCVVAFVIYCHIAFDWKRVRRRRRWKSKWKCWRRGSSHDIWFSIFPEMLHLVMTPCVLQLCSWQPGFLRHSHIIWYYNLKSNFERKKVYLSLGELGG